MSYPRFTKIIIDYFMSKDQSISRRNKMFWHTARDDTMITAMRCISRHEETQVYGTILLKELTNQAMLESKAYKTYYAFASGEKTPKPKYVQKKADPDTSPKKKPVQASKGDGTNFESGVPDEQHLKTTGADEGTGTIPGVLDIPKYEFESEKESWERVNKKKMMMVVTEHEEEDIDERVYTPSDYELTNDEKINDEERMDEEEEDEVTNELYKDVNVNLGNKDTEMTNADQGGSGQQNVSQESGFDQVEEDAHLLNLENPSPAV
ncbi:hypothetical protein Tco_1381057 [Tanacetum coccineum]